MNPPIILGKECQKDPDFEGSLDQKIGNSQWLCPECGAHLRKSDEGNLICLNACTFPGGTKRFAEFTKALMSRTQTRQ